MSALAVVKANLLINEYGITHPAELDLTAIAYDKGLFVQEKKLNGSDGRLIRKGNVGLIFTNTLIREEGKKRFVIAHELGHYELHKNNRSINICDESSFVNWNKNGPQENEANIFASELLFPKLLFQNYSQGKLFNKGLIIDLASNFRCSISATAIRYADIGDIPIAVVYSQNKIKKWYKCNKNFPFQFVDLKTKVSSNSYTYDYFEGETVPDEPEEIIADAWFEKDFNYKSNYPLLEQNIPFTSYNAILTLLWEIK